MKRWLTVGAVLLCTAALGAVTGPETRVERIPLPPHPNVLNPPDGCTAAPSGLLTCKAGYTDPGPFEPRLWAWKECKGACID